jgi:phosphate starvation-inducible PhoH-like protein
LELTIHLPHGQQRLAVTGTAEQNLKIIRETLGVSITARNGSLKLSGEQAPVGRAAHIIERLGEAAAEDNPITRADLLEMIASVNAEAPPQPGAMASERAAGDRKTSRVRSLDVYLEGKRIKALTAGQQHYLDLMRQHDLTFCTGPAGTGKTYLAVATAVAMLKKGEVRKLVLVRPAVEAGEKLGFLPGSMQEKVNPYLRPLLDALHDMMPFEQIQRFMTCDLIEIVPLAFMRGRTLNNAMVICDEAQNTTVKQMLMLLTRLGYDSKMVVTGDISQIDLEAPGSSGLIDALRRLKNTKGVAQTALKGEDIVRHELVQRIVEAYDDSDAQDQPSPGE